MLLKILKYIFGFFPALLSMIINVFSIFPASLERLDKDIADQIERLASLESYYKGNESAVFDEASIYNGILKDDLDSSIKFNEMSFIGTHNSYQNGSIDEFKKLYKNLSDITFGAIKAEGAEFYSETLTDQLNNGIRSFELDIETFDRDGEVTFTCMHNPYFDMGTSCYDLSLAMKEICLWSDNNPDHLPITVIIEPKRVFIPLQDMKFFNLDYVKKLDSTLRSSLGDKLFTPSEMLRDYSSFGEMRRADDWCEVKSMLGKVVVLLHDCGVTEAYISLDRSIKSQAMFPMLRKNDIDRDCTSFILANKPEELLLIADEIKEKKIMVRTRADKFTQISEKRREMALLSGANIISTDYPIRADIGNEGYFFSFGGFTTVKGNR